MSGAGARPDLTIDPIERELARTLFRLGPFAQAVSLLAGLILALALSPVVPLKILATWYVLLAATAGFRISLILRYQSSRPEGAAFQDLLRNYRRGLVASGIAWGAAPLLTAPTYPIEYLAVTVMVIAGITAGAAMVLAALRGHLMLFALPAVIPAAAVLLARGDLTGIMAGLLVAYFILAMRKIEADLHGVLRNNVTLSADNIALAESLEAANIGLVGEAEDQTKRAKRAEAQARMLHTLYQTTNVEGATVDARLRKMLTIGCRYFAVPHGIVSRIEGGTYTVREVVAIGAPTQLSVGDQIPLDDAVCALTYESDEPVAFVGADQRSDVLADHPAVDTGVFCRSYIGARIHFNDRTYGTMCFYDSDRRSKGFEKIDHEFVRLMAQWVSRELSEQLLQDALVRKADELALITNSVNAGIAYTDEQMTFRYANRRYRESLAAGQQDIVGRHLREVLGEERYQSIEADLKRCLAGEEVRYLAQRSDGEGNEIVRDVSLVPDRGPDDSVQGIFALVYDVTDVWALRSELDAKVKELELITDSVDAGIGYTDAQRIFRFVNAAYASYFGKNADEVIGCHLSEVVGEESYADIEEYGARCLAGERVRYQAVGVDHAGRHRVRDVSLIPDEATDGTVQGIFTVVHDITAERELQAELDRKVRQLRTITDSVEAGIGYLDPDLRFVFANRHYSTLVGRDGQDLSGMTVEEVVGEENYPEVRGYLERVLAGEAISYETKRNYNPASPSYLLVNIEPDVRDDSVVGMFVFGTDITEFRVAEAALAAETDLAETTLDSISEAVIRIGADGVVDFINPAAEDLIGLRADLARGRALVEVLPLVFSDGRQLAPMVMRKVVGQRTRFESEEELWLKRPGNAGGSWVMCLAVPLHGGPDGVGEGLVMLRDVTAQRREIQELAYRASHDTLTGLRNRREFERQLDRAVEEAAAGAAPFALIFMDLDGFKEINDAKGHLAGDQFLAQIGEAMRVVTRQEDVLARIGGDEFAVLARNCNVTAARAIAEKLLAAVRETRLTWDGVQFGVGISIGIAPVGTDAVDSRTVMNLADQACYAAKRAGKDRVEVATSDSGPVH